MNVNPSKRPSAYQLHKHFDNWLNDELYADIFNSADEKRVNKDESNSNIRINVTSTTSTTRQLEDLNIDKNRSAISQLSDYNLFDVKEFKSSIGNFANTTNHYT
ncbi:9448_t:CDS:1 [Dentiscutata heterogama]|uniref:9448_t:CDS:1 n=1 Tax=Dentiscutata heterogama TaxID=1316150 RepID=A0ACA9K2Q4_9GLOM|nr:9448_t:CDS:1 [Dentiscutata heterogama]